MHYRRILVFLALSLALLIRTAANLQAQTPVPLRDLLLFTPTPVAPGSTPSIRPIEYTQVVEGRLEPDSSIAVYTFRGQQGDAVTIHMKALTFNAYLTLIDAYGGEVAWDDDSGGYPDALLGPYMLPETGDYQIRASSIDNEPRGAFTLHLNKVEVAMLAFGESADVTFTERDPAAYFAFNGKVGDVLNIAVNSDGKLDTRLRVRGVGESYDLIADDDSGTGFDPEITRLIIPYDNQYIVAVEPYAPGMTGTARLTIGSSPLASLDDGTQTISLGSKRSQDVTTFAGRAGEQARITVVVTNGRTDYLTIRVTQNGQEITSITSGFVGELSFLITAPLDERVNVLFESSTNVVVEVALERV